MFRKVVYKIDFVLDLDEYFEHEKEEHENEKEEQRLLVNTLLFIQVYEYTFVTNKKHHDSTNMHF